jgi:DNA uptake protein ComE-like DNA-binding protein
VLGAGVRVVRAASRGSAPASQPALERQQQSADSAAHATQGGKKSSGAKRTPAAKSDTTRKAAVRDSIKRAHAGPMDRPGYLNGKLDLDVASAAQIDSLPGVTALMARRIAADRIRQGPFLSRDGLRRVSGAGPSFIAGIDSLVYFSGTFVQPSAADTIVLPPRRKRPPAKRRPVSR